MFQAQRAYLKAIVKNDKYTIYFLPRKTGKTYVKNYLKRLGNVATPATQEEKG